MPPRKPPSGPTKVPFSPIQAVDNAPVSQWGTDGGTPVVAPDVTALPAGIADSDGNVYVTSMIGVLWGAVAQLSASVTTLQQQVAALQTPPGKGPSTK